MELIVTVTKKELIDKISKIAIDGVIFGSAFSNKYNYNLEEFKEINLKAYNKGLKRYVSIDAMIHEDDKASLYYYFEILKEINPDGIYFADLGVIKVAQIYGLKDKLIYDPVTLITNSLDAKFYLVQGIGCVLSRELSLDEAEKILKNNPEKLDMQVFGHLRMSYSRREFLTNYFKEIKQDKNIKYRNDLSLVEETREYKLPIRETRYGTEVYSDFCLAMFNEMVGLSQYIKRGIIDLDFLPMSTALEAIKAFDKMNKENVTFMVYNLIKDNPEVTFDTGYLYRKTTDKKEDNE